MLSLHAQLKMWKMGLSLSEIPVRSRPCNSNFLLAKFTFCACERERARKTFFIGLANFVIWWQPRLRSIFFKRMDRKRRKATRREARGV